MPEALAPGVREPEATEHTGVLATKLFVPRPLEGFIARRRLLDDLDGGIAVAAAAVPRR